MSLQNFTTTSGDSSNSNQTVNCKLQLFDAALALIDEYKFSFIKPEAEGAVAIQGQGETASGIAAIT